MECVYQKEDKQLIIRLTEEIDHHLAEKIRRRVDYEVQRYIPKKVVFDFACVNFMDSAGIGLIIGRYKLVTMLGGVLTIRGANNNVKKILEMSGILKIVQLEEIKQAI